MREQSTSRSRMIQNKTRLYVSWRVWRIQQESLCVFSVYAQIFSVYSLNMIKNFPRIRRRICVPQMAQNLSFSPYTLQNFPHIFYSHFYTFHAFSIYALKLSAYVFSKYAVRLNNTQKEIFFSNKTDDFTKTIFEKTEQGVIYWPSKCKLQI